MSQRPRIRETAANSCERGFPSPHRFVQAPFFGDEETRVRKRREKTFGFGRAVPLDGNAKARVAAYARAWSHRNRRPGQHKGPLTRSFLEVMGALLWGFHNTHSGHCFPSYEAIAAKAGCARSTVAEAIKALEWAGVLTWQHRITRVRERCTDLFGRAAWRWRVLRTSNAYVFRDPKPSESDNRTGTPKERILSPVQKPVIDPDCPLERALARLQQTMAARNAIEQGERTQ